MSVFPFAHANEGDQASVIATLVSAFIEDPVERWLWPEPRQYLTHFPTFVAAFGGEAFARQAVWTLGEFAAVLARRGHSDKGELDSRRSAHGAVGHVRRHRSAKSRSGGPMPGGTPTRCAAR